MTSNSRVASDQKPFLDTIIGGIVDRPKKRKKSQVRQRIYREAAAYDKDEHELFLANVARSGLSKAGYIRLCTLGDPGPRTQKQPHPDLQLLAIVLGQLGKIGSNLSQLDRLDSRLSGLQEGLNAVSDMRAYLQDVLAKRSPVDPERLDVVLASLDLAGQIINDLAHLANSKGVEHVDPAELKQAIANVVRQTPALIEATQAGVP